MTTILDLARKWRERADDDLVPDHVAAAVKVCANELEKAVHEYETEALTVAEWAEENGYAESTVRSMLSDGRLPNVGEPYRPRIRRCDQPDAPARLRDVDEQVKRMA